MASNPTVGQIFYKEKNENLMEHWIWARGEERGGKCQIQHLVCWIKSLHGKNKLGSGPRKGLMVGAIKRDHLEVARAISGSFPRRHCCRGAYEMTRKIPGAGNIKKLEANTNLEAERRGEIRKRQVVSSAKLKLLERTVRIPSRFFKKNKIKNHIVMQFKSICLDSRFPFLS